MKFKEPRDPNTKSVILKLRDIPESEHWPCHVGGGECHNNAVEAQDDGQGGEFLVCRYHLEEVYAFGKLIAEMSNNQMNELEALIKDAE